MLQIFSGDRLVVREVKLSPDRKGEHISVEGHTAAAGSARGSWCGSPPCSSLHVPSAVASLWKGQFHYARHPGL